jgi:predicted Zn-dependent peptidase
VYRGEYQSVADDLKQIRAVTQKDIRTVLEQFPLKMVTTAGIGPLNELPH